MSSSYLSLILAVAAALPVVGQDAEGCKDHPLFNRLPGFHIGECKQSQFDQKHFPIAPAKEEGGEAPSNSVEGKFYYLLYQLPEGQTKPSPLQIMRNFQNAARKGGGTIVAEFPGWCKSGVHESLHNGNNCILYGTTMKFGAAGKETWAFVESNGEGESYELWILEREAMKQEIAVGEIRDQLNKDGFVALYINFDTGSAAIQADSMALVEQVAGLLKSEAGLKVEVGGHTDNVGTAEANLKLSDARAKAVMEALVKQGVAAARMTAKGYGQTMPIADNRLEEGRAKNRRVELVKK